MSLMLDRSLPQDLEARFDDTGTNGVDLCVGQGLRCQISADDFAVLVQWWLSSNIPLTADDPRQRLVDYVCHLQRVPSRNKGSYIFRYHR